MDIAQIICTPFSYIVSWVNEISGSYVLALLAFTVVMKLVMFPLSIKQQKNSVRQAKLRPREEAIRAKYAGRTDKPTQQKMQQEIMEMYQEEKFSPLSGCFPLLIQLPLLLILYGIVRQPLLYTARYTNDEINVLNTVMALTEHYDARLAMEGAKGGEFSLERNEDGSYIFYDPLTGKDCRVVEKAEGNQTSLVFYEEKSEGKFKKDPVKFIKKTPHVYADENTGEETLAGLPAYPMTQSGAQKDQSAMVNVLKHNAAHYEKYYDVVRDGKAGDFSTAKELDLANNLPNFELFGGAIDLGATPALTEMNWLLIFPVLTFITSYGSQWLTRKYTYQPATTAESQSSMRMMNVMMPMMSVAITFMVPCALAVYWILQNLISPLQQIILAKCWPVPKYSEEELKKLKNEYVAKQKGKTDKKSIPAPKRRSLVYDDDEEETPVAEETPAEKPAKAKKKAKKAEEESPIGKADLK